MSQCIKLNKNKQFLSYNKSFQLKAILNNISGKINWTSSNEKVAIVDSNGKVIRSERYTGSCSRKFYVGEGYKEEDFAAKFENGELMITFPKTEPEKIEEKKAIMIE